MTSSHVPLVALGHGDDLVVGLQRALAGGRAAGNDGRDHRVAVLPAQRGPDPLQREAHGDVEVLQVVRGQVGRVRVVGAGEGVEEGRHHVVVRVALDAEVQRAVALAQHLVGRRGLLPAQGQLQHLALEAPPQQPARLPIVDGVGRLLAVHLEGLVALQIEAFVQQARDLRIAPLHALQEALVHPERHPDVPTAHLLLQPRGQPAELQQVAPQEVVMPRVVAVHVAPQHFRGMHVVEGRAAVVVAQEHARDVRHVLPAQLHGGLCVGLRTGRPQEQQQDRDRSNCTQHGHSQLGSLGDRASGPAPVGRHAPVDHSARTFKIAPFA